MATSHDRAAEYAGEQAARNNHIALCRQAGNDRHADELIFDATQETIERIKRMPKDELHNDVLDFGIEAVGNWNREIIAVIRDLLK